MNIKELFNILDTYQISIKKRYGQNFLLDNNVLNNIIEKSGLKDNPKTINVIEIGPGLGFLTEKILMYAKKLVSYEIDEEFIKVLNDKFKTCDNFSLINKDFLKVNLTEDINKEFNNERTIVIANLPYYITTPILLKILEETSLVDKMIVMMQKEVAMRLCGVPKTKDYNSLSVLIQYFTNVKLLFNVSPKSFYPAPDVDSSVILIEYRKEYTVKATNLPYFLKFNRVVFAQRRKTIINNIMANYPSDIYTRPFIQQILNENNIDVNARAESLDVDQIVNLANSFYAKVNK